MSVQTQSSTPSRLREGLVVMPDAETGRGRVVKDPKTRKYYRFGELEGFIIGCLDGHRTAIDIQIECASRLGEDLSLDEIQEFIDTLREKGLIEDDLPCLPVEAPNLGEQVYSALEQGGFRFRRADEPLPPGIAATRRNPAEARLFDEAVALLRGGRFSAALRAFEEILSANPQNQRAAAIRSLLLQAGSVRASQAQAEAPSSHGSPFYFRLPLFNPDRIFTALEPIVRWVWTPAFLGLYLGLVAVAGWIALTHRAVLAERIPDLSAMSWAGGILVAAVILTAAHEFSHGLTCKHFGGKVPELGFLLIFFFMPALYVDVSDAWLFRRRRQRTLVSLAGPMFDLGAASAALVAWWVVPAGPLQVACVFSMTASMGSVLMNLNPLMRLDGYYILSDLSGIPNLRSAAMRALSRMLSRRRSGQPDVQLTPRARVFVGVFAVLSTIYIAFILFIMGRLVVGISTSVAGLWGPVLLAALITWLLRRPLAGLARKLAGRARRATPRGVLTLAATGAALAMMLMIPWNLRVSGPINVEAKSRVAVRPEVTGNVAEVLVHEGDRVEAGQIVARLDRSELLSELTMTRSEIERSRSELELLVNGPERGQIRQARERIRAAAAEASHLRSRFDRLSRLRDEGLVSADLYEEVGKELAISEGGLRAAQEEARLLERGSRPERISAARADVARLETRAADILRRLAACDLRAPLSGVVVSPDLEKRAGERVAAGNPLLEIADTSTLVTEIAVLEAEIGDVRLGQSVGFRLAAFPDRRFEGEVLEIAPVASVDDIGRAVFRVRCAVEDVDGLMRPGMTGAAKIEAGRHPIGKLMLRRVLRLIDPSLL